jgi:hypothetical protein
MGRPTIVDNMPFLDYLKEPGLSNSELDSWNVSAKYAHYRASTPIEPTAAMRIGSAVDCMLTTPSLFDHLFYEGLEIPKTTNANKEIHARYDAENAGKTKLTISEFEQVKASAEAAQSHPVAKNLLNNLQGQPSLFFEIEHNGETIPAKARLDGWLPAFKTIIEIKTTRDASVDGFPREFFNRGYHRKSAFYLQAARSCGLEPEAIIFIAISNSDCPDVTTWVIPPEVVAMGAGEIPVLIDRKRSAEKSGIFSGYSNDLLTLSAPRWKTQNTME